MRPGQTKSAGRNLSRHMLVVAGYPERSVALCADTNAHTGSSKTYAAVLVVTPALDITLTRGVSVRITGLTDDDAALTAFTPATTVFIVALRCDRCTGGKRCGGSSSHEKRACSNCQRDRQDIHGISPKVIVSA